MRTTTYLAIVGAAALTMLAGCTVKDVDQPALAGPSTLAHSIVMTADRNTLTQNGVDFTDIRIVSLGPNGQSEAIPLTAQVFVDGVAQDFGTLSTKNPVTPTTIRYTSPAGSSNPQAQATSVVTIAVVPTSSGDFRAEVARQLDLRLTPQGVILPSNPNLVPLFTVTPNPPQAQVAATFDASGTTNNGAACNQACSYTWDFGDGTSGTGITTTHTYTRAGNFAVKLTVTDARGAQSQLTQSFTVATAPQPTADFNTSPGSPGVNQDVFFDATASKPAAGRTLTAYDWTFGDGLSGTGSVTAHKYTGPGNYQVSLVVTDDVGTKSNPKTVALQVGPAVGPTPTAAMTCIAGNASKGVPVSCNASASQPGSGATIATFTFEWGDGSPAEVQTSGVQSHLYPHAGTFTVTMTVTDTLGRKATNQQTVIVAP